MLRISSSSKLSEKKHGGMGECDGERRLPKGGHVLFDFIQVIFGHAFRLILLLTLHDVPFDQFAYHRLVFDLPLVDLADDFLGTNWR